jgi:hypothetical protein
MIENPGIDSLKNILTLLKPSGQAFSFRVGEIIRAKIIHTGRQGDVLLRLLTSGEGQGKGEQRTIRAHTEVPLKEGQSIFLQVLKGDRNVTLRYMGDSAGIGQTHQQALPAKVLHLLSQISSSRMDNQDIMQFLTVLKALPQSIRKAIPEFQNLEKFLLNVRNIDGQQVRAFIERSGVAFETRLKFAAADRNALLESLLALQSEGDLKSLLLKLRQALKDRKTVALLKEGGYSIAELSTQVSRCIRHIEFFQLTSRVQDMFYTFLPLLWDDLRDGEMLFRKDRRDGKEAYTCDLNLDLVSLGLISLSVTAIEGSFYLTVLASRAETADLIETHRHLLEQRFASQGLLLKALNVSRKEDITFGEVRNHGVSVLI